MNYRTEGCYLRADFRPQTEPGWRVWLGYVDADGAFHHETLPLAGWLIEAWVWEGQDGRGVVDPADRRIEPAVWVDEEGLQPVYELGSRDIRYAVIGPGQICPDPAEVEAQLRARITRAQALGVAR